MLRISTYIFLFVTCLSCIPEEEVHIIEGDLKDYKVDEFTLVLDEVSSGMSLIFQYNKFGTDEYLMMVETGGVGSTSAPNIDLYSINTGEKVRRLHVPREGPNGVPMSSKAWMLNLDSLLLITTNKMYYMDWEGKIINQIGFDNFIENASDKIPQISNYSPPIFLKNELIVGLLPGFKDSQLWLPEKRFIKFPMEENAVSEIVSFGYPEIYSEYNNDPNYKAMFIQEVEDEIYLSFALGDSVYKWDGQTIKPEFSLRSLNDHKFYYYPIEKTSEGHLKVTSPAFSAAYISMLYDPYRKLFYRILRQENLQIKNDMGNIKHSVLVADINGNFLAELEFYRRDYLQYSSFIHPKGLALARSKENDDELRFEIFDINKVLEK